ncbi:MAG: amino acid adenylation domain-containing protein [Pyrinomonadaceae bacterium]
MDEINERMSSLSPAKRALLELRLKESSAGLAIVNTGTALSENRAAPTSFSQQRLWFLHQLESDQAAYNVPRAMRLKGPLDVAALRLALAEIVQRHDVLRTRFANVDGDVQQFVTSQEIPLAVIDLSHLARAEQEAHTESLMAAEAKRPFNLERGPVLRTTLLRLGEQEHVLLLTSHHIVSDGWSAEILFRELSALYNAFTNGKPSPLTPLTIQYADFAAWQRKWLHGALLEEQLAYWKKHLADVSGVLSLPTDHPRPAVQSFRGAYKSLTFPARLSEEIAEVSRRHGVTIFMTQLAAFAVLLQRYTGEDDIVVGSPIAGRNRQEIEGLIGFFLNTLVLRLNLSGNPSFSELLMRVREVALEAYAHQELPFEKLVEELEPERTLSSSPLFQVMFSSHRAARGHFNLSGLAVEHLPTASNTSKFDLSLFVWEQADEKTGGSVCTAEYNTDLFDEVTIERLLEHYHRILESAVAHPERRLSEFSLLTESQRKQLLFGWNCTDAKEPTGTISDLFEAQVARTPKAVAVEFGEQQLTYEELNSRSNQLAHYLRRFGVGPETRVAICLERSLEMIVGLFGILKAGAAYVPLEPTYPSERLFFQLDDSQARLLLTRQHLLQSVSVSHVQTISLDGDWREIARESSQNPTRGADAANSAHLIYTSGSTGLPKGVLSSHRASVNRFSWMWKHYPFADGEICCQKTALSFVDSIWEIFGPLLQGIPLVIIPDDTVKDPQEFITALSVNEITRLVLVPSLLRVMLEIGDAAKQLTDLRYCFCSGETLPVDLATSFRAQLPHTKLVNLYGSSEVGADVTYHEVRSTELLETIPIGRPIANTQIYILDSDWQPVPVGILGELYVGGEPLAYSYLNRPELTAEKFVPHPFSRDRGARLFRTGDIGRYLADGNIEYRGRRDTQVKVRGFRVELEEIASQLTNHPQVHQAVVVARDDGRGEKQLLAYVIVEGEAPASNELRAHLRRKLPDHMIPAIFILLDELPLTASGKVNRLALPRPTHESETQEKFIAPRNLTEEILVDIWADVLSVENPGVDDDFFALGGHSLLLARLAARIRESFRLDLTLRDLFEAPTVAAISERIEAMRRVSDGFKEAPLIPISRNGALPLSFAQERLWFFDQMEPTNAAYNISRVLRLTGILDRRALQRSLDTIVARHEVLRTSFLVDEGKPALSIAPCVMVEIPLFDLSELPSAVAQQKINELAREETARSFKLAHGPLLRLTLVKAGDAEHVLLLTMHHIISDGWSINVFMRELVKCYNALTTDTSPDLPSLTVQYVDFVAWQRQRLRGSALQKQLDYWCNQLAGAPAVIDLPLDRSRPALRSFRGARQMVVISKEVTRKLKALARPERATLFMTLLAAFQSLLSCLTNQDDVVVGSPTAGRDRREFELLIGYFVNILVLRGKFSGDPSFVDTLRRTREVALDAFAHQDVPFERLVEELKPARGLQYNPIFQVLFVFQNAPNEREELNSLTAESLALEVATTRHDLQLSLWETANGLEGAFTYSTDLFEAETIVSMTEQFQALLSLVAEEPNITLSVLRAAVDETGRAFRRRTTERLGETGRKKLKSTSRKPVTGIPKRSCHQTELDESKSY